MVLVIEEEAHWMERQSVVECSSLNSWANTSSPVQPTAYKLSYQQPTPFPLDPLVNNRLFFWQGDITHLRVDAVVHSTDEIFSERCPVSHNLFRKAGPGLKQELIDDFRDCRTEDVIVTSGYRLPSRYIIHTIGPKYNPKFQNAADIALHNCYRNVLQKAYEMKISTLGLCVINSVRRNYPPDEGAHVALRTIRRFLESGFQYPNQIVLTVTGSDVGVYEVLLPLYFPRTLKEEMSATSQLPSNVIGPLGETVHPERQIRIIDNPQHVSEDDCSVIDLSDHFDMMGDPELNHDMDHHKLLGEKHVTSLDPVISRELHTKERIETPHDSDLYEIQENSQYDRLLRRAKTEDLSEVSGIGCLYQCGCDRYGRPLIVFIGRWFKFKDINLDKALLYLIYLLDPLVKSDYVIAYFHTNTTNANYPSLNWLKQVYSILPYKYKKNLKGFYIVHPTLWTKMVAWWFTTFMAPAIKNKVHSLPGVEYLYSVVRPVDLEIPAFITEYDMTVNGLRYFNYNSPT